MTIPGASSSERMFGLKQSTASTSLHFLWWILSRSIARFFVKKKSDKNNIEKRKASFSLHWLMRK
jgi:hypothetical protein